MMIICPSPVRLTGTGMRTGCGAARATQYCKKNRDWSRYDPNIAFHAEAGSIFTHVTGQDILRGNRMPDTRNKTVYGVYRCPSTGPIGLALRVNFSMTSYMNGQTSGVNPGVKYSIVRNPSEKFLLLNEDPHSMRNASFHPHGTAFGNRNGQAVGVNAMGEKIHTMHKTGINAGYFDGHARASSMRGSWKFRVAHS